MIPIQISYWFCFIWYDNKKNEHRQCNREDSLESDVGNDIILNRISSDKSLFECTPKRKKEKMIH